MSKETPVRAKNEQKLSKEERARRRAKIKRSKRIGFFLTAIQLIVSIAFLGLIFHLNILPGNYLAAVIVILLFFLAFDFLCQYSKKRRLTGKVFAVIISVVLCIGIYYLYGMDQFLLSDGKKADATITKKPFSIYVTGIDTYDSNDAQNRSDVNIIITVNPRTKQILMVSTPRDYYVDLYIADDEKDSGSNVGKDKLTHAGSHGYYSSMRTLEHLYDIDLKYYMRMNFTGFEEIVDALGGVTVYNEESFTSIDGYYIEGGTVTLNGEYALAFARERKAFSNGDNQRGINQMKVIRAMIDKMMSKQMLLNYTDILNSIKQSMSSNFLANVAPLIKMQLKDMADWNIVSYHVVGSNGHELTYSYPNNTSYVMLPDEESIQTAKDLMQQVLKGKTIKDPE